MKQKMDYRQSWDCKNCGTKTKHNAGKTEPFPGLSNTLRRTHICSICKSELATVEIEAESYLRDLHKVNQVRTILAS
jgi:hypothetical protein